MHVVEAIENRERRRSRTLAEMTIQTEIQRIKMQDSVCREMEILAREHNKKLAVELEEKERSDKSHDTRLAIHCKIAILWQQSLTELMFSAEQLDESQVVALRLLT